MYNSRQIKHYILQNEKETNNNYLHSFCYGFCHSFFLYFLNNQWQLIIQSNKFLYILVQKYNPTKTFFVKWKTLSNKDLLGDKRQQSSTPRRITGV